MESWVYLGDWFTYQDGLPAHRQSTHTVTNLSRHVYKSDALTPNPYATDPLKYTNKDNLYTIHKKTATKLQMTDIKRMQIKNVRWCSS